jgi:NAD(P)H-hydrate epimerase
MLPALSILTPHPGEFDRLAGKSDSGFSRNQKQIEFASKYKVIILLKGAFTSVAMPDGTCCFNSTGNPGMSTAGSGDVLTGIIMSLLAQGYPPTDAALLGAFIHGLAGDLAAAEYGQQSLIATDIIDYLGKAFLKLENHEPYA